MWRTLKSLPRTVWLIGLISLINDSASDMLYPLIPLYLSSVLMAGPRVLGIIEGVAEATSSLLKLFSGVVVDRTRRFKPWIVLGYGLAGGSRPFIALVTGWAGVLVIRFVDRVGKGLRSSPRDALLAASIAPEQRGVAFGLHRAMDNAGAVVGPLVAWGLLESGVGLREIFLWSAVPAALCLGLSLALSEPRAVTPTPSRGFDWSLRGMSPRFKRYLVVVGLFSLGNSSNMFLLLRANELGVSTAHTTLLWAAVSAVAMIFATPLAALSDRYGRMALLVGGYGAYALFYLGLGTTASGGYGLFAWFGFYGLFMAATEGVEKALVADLAPGERRGAAFGWFNLITGMALLPASVIFGWLWQVADSGMAFGFSAGCALLAGVLLRFWVFDASD